jgi:hypothetical protein
MNRGAAITTVQSIAVILGCAAIGVSLTRVPGGEASDAFSMALGGGAIGLVGVVVGLLVRGPVHEQQQHKTPRQLAGLRLSTVGLLVAMVGWLLVVFVHATLGSYVMVTGILSGIAGIIIHNVNTVGGREK